MQSQIALESTAIAEAFGTTLEDLSGRARGAWIAHRRMALYRALMEAGYSGIVIGQLLGRDHSTVYVGSRQAARLVRTDPDMRSLATAARTVLRLSRANTVADLDKPFATTVAYGSSILDVRAADGWEWRMRKKP
jgi:chromosomal replication initiation ATPase DnaA